MTRPSGTTHGVTGRTVLVTGGAGFIGSHIADALVAENDVRVLDDLSSGVRAQVPDEAELFVGDVGDPALLADAMAGVDVVFHEAAVVSVEQSVRTPVATEETNVVATLRLLERARQVDARVVLASSAAVYGHPERLPVDEEHPLAPTSPYGVTKLAADEYARLYSSLYDLPTVALRYFNVYGPRQRGGDYSAVIGTFLDQARSGGPITVDGDGEQTRDFVHVRDVVRANLRAATTPHVGEAFNVGTGDAVSIRELAEFVRTVTGSDASITHTDPREGDIRHSRADVGRAADRLGFEATTSLETGLETMVDGTD